MGQYDREDTQGAEPSKNLLTVNTPAQMQRLRRPGWDDCRRVMLVIIVEVDDAPRPVRRGDGGAIGVRLCQTLPPACCGVLWMESVTRSMPMPWRKIYSMPTNLILPLRAHVPNFIVRGIWNYPALSSVMRLPPSEHRCPQQLPFVCLRTAHR